MLFFFVFLLHVAWEHNVKGGGPRGTPSVEAYCPFGGVETVYQVLTTGGFIHRIEPSTMVLMVAVLLLTFLFARGFCGWICPFGSLQEWIGLLGKRLLRRRFNPAGRWDRMLRYTKYVLLAVIIGLTWHWGALVFRPYDPFLAFFHLGEHIDEMPYAYAALVLVLVGSLVIERFFCKYACPLGAVLGLAGKFSLSRLERDPGDCKACNLCQKECFAHVDFLKNTTIQDADCNHCMDCLEDCPKPTVLSVRVWRWRLSHSVYAVLMVLGLFSFIGISKATAYWRTKPETVSFRNAKGELDPAQIRGWMTLEEVSSGYGVPLDELYKRSGLPAQVAPATRLNQVAKNYHLAFEAEAVRDAVQGKQQAPAAKQTGSHEGEEVRGTMTLNEVSAKTKVPAEYLIGQLKLPKDVNRRIPMREFLHDKGLSMQDVREAIRAYRAQRK